jgi:hypothetical protein
VYTASITVIALMMEALNTSVTSVYFNETTRPYIQKVVIFIFAAVRTRNLIFVNKFLLLILFSSLISFHYSLRFLSFWGPVTLSDIDRFLFHAGFVFYGFYCAPYLRIYIYIYIHIHTCVCLCKKMSRYRHAGGKGERSITPTHS